MLSKKSYLFIFKYLIVIYGILADLVQLDVPSLFLSPLSLGCILLP